MMCNPHRGDVEITLDDKVHIARLTLGAIAVLETRLATSSLQELATRFESGQMSMQDVLEVLSVALGVPVDDIAAMDIKGGAAGAAQAAALLLQRGFTGNS